MFLWCHATDVVKTSVTDVLRVMLNLLGARRTDSFLASVCEKSVMILRRWVSCLPVLVCAQLLDSVNMCSICGRWIRLRHRLLILGRASPSTITLLLFSVLRFESSVLRSRVLVLVPVGVPTLILGLRTGMSLVVMTWCLTLNRRPIIVLSLVFGVVMNECTPALKIFPLDVWASRVLSLGTGPTSPVLLVRLVSFPLIPRTDMTFPMLYRQLGAG